MNAAQVLAHLRAAMQPRPEPVPVGPRPSVALHDRVRMLDAQYAGRSLERYLLGQAPLEEALLDAIEDLLAQVGGFDDDKQEAVDEAQKDGFKEGQDEAEQRLTGEKEDLQRELDEAREELEKLKASLAGRSVDEQTAALSDERRGARRELLGRLQAAYAGPARDLRRRVNTLVGELLREINEGV